MKRGRKPHAVPHERLKVYIPVDLLAEINLRFWDPVLKRPQYSARGDLIEMLLRQWLAEQRRDSVTIPKADVEAAQ